MRIEMELKPGTPEYQAEYDKEMQRLEAESKVTDKPEAKEATTSPDKPEAKADEKPDAKPETDDETKKRLEALEKSLKDTQAWGHRNAAEVARLKKEAEERKRAETRPAILEANPGLEDAIKHVAGTPPEKPAQEQWLGTVATAIPDVEALLGDQGFYAKAQERRAQLGSEWDNPIVAIRELSSLKTEHLSNQRTQVAVEAARKDFEAKAKKRSAMDVPGGSGGKDAVSSAVDPETDFAHMSKEKFDKVRSRVMGY